VSRPDTVTELDSGELAREPRNLGLIAYYDGWGQSVGMAPMTYPRTLTDAEGEHWQEGWNEGKAQQAEWERRRTFSAAGPVTKPGPTPHPPDGFHQAPNWSNRWVCNICETRGLPGGKWMETHRRGHAPCPRCGRQLTVKLDGTPRVHTRCPSKGPTWSTSPRA